MTSASCAQRLISAIVRVCSDLLMYCGSKPCSMSIPRRCFGKSFTCPLLAITLKSLPKNDWYALILFGDSSITSDFVITHSSTTLGFGVAPNVQKSAVRLLHTDANFKYEFSALVSYHFFAARTFFSASFFAAPHGEPLFCAPFDHP